MAVKVLLNNDFEYFLVMAVFAWPVSALYIQGGPKSKPPPICQKIVLKIANEIRFLCKVKV